MAVGPLDSAAMPAGLDGATDRVESAARSALIATLAAEIAGRARRPNLLVGVDGASGAGKSTLADELAEAVGASVVRATIDSFHRPRAERYRLGPDSPEGYYRESHQLDVVRSRLLDPWRAGAGDYVTAVFDEPTDTPVVDPPRPVPVDHVLLFDGLFLHRPELVDAWDLTVFLVADQRRAAAGHRPRYVEGQRRYEAEADPRRRATFVIDNDDLAEPRFL